MAHKILVVDDERTSVQLMQSFLTGKGYDVITAMDGEEGFEKVERENPDLIILDVVMPKMNGYDFMKDLKALQGFTTTPVIMLTSNETMEDLFSLEGVRGYFVKPVKPPVMLEKIKEALGQKQE